MSSSVSLIVGFLVGLLIPPLIRTYLYHRHLRQSDYIDLDTLERRQMAVRDEML